MRILWRRVAALAAGLVAFNVAAHVALPGINFPAFLRFLHDARVGSWWWLYDRIGGGGLSRASIVALGFAPYLTARVWVWLAARLVPRVRRLREHASGQLLLRRWTRGLTIGASLVQSYGFARRLLDAPEVVLQPGPGFVVRMMAVLTGGAAVAMLLSETAETLITQSTNSDVPSESGEDPATVSPPQLREATLAPVLETAPPTNTTHRRGRRRH